MKSTLDPEPGPALLPRCAAVRFETAEPQWRQFLAVLRMPLFAYSAVRNVLREGRWKGATYPVAYVRRAAWREARRLGLVDRAGPPTLIVPRTFTHDGWIDFLSYADDDIDDDSPMLRVDHCFLSAAGGTEEVDFDVDWDAVGQRAGLDEAELLLLKRRATGSARAELPADQQAAWRRLVRKYSTLRRVLHTGKPDPPTPR